MSAVDLDRLERQLSGLASAVSYPPTPSLAAAVNARLAHQGSERPRRFRLAVAVAAALFLLAAATAVLLVRDSREAVADFLGLAVRGERIEILPAAPSPAPGVSPTPTAPPLDAVAERTTLEVAAAVVPFEPYVPPGVAVTDVFLLEFLGVPGLVLRTPTFDLWQFENENVFIGKGGGAGHIRVDTERVDGQPAYWVTGGPRVLVGRDAAGNETTGVEISTSVNALIWAEGGITFRLEGDLSREEAIAIAEALQ